MSFSAKDKEVLLAIKGVGKTFIGRLEQMGFSSLEQLACADATEILRSGAALTGSTCWANSPLAKSAVKNSIAAAKSAVAAS